MRVAHVINSLTRASGLSYFCARLVQHLAECGVDVDLYVWWVGDDALLPVHPRIRVIETRHTGLQVATLPDLFHIHSMWVPAAHKACQLARRHRVPYIVSPHGTLTAWALRHKWWKKLPALLAYQYRDLRLADAMHATAHSEVQDIRRLWLRNVVAVAPVGTDLPVAPAARQPAQQGRPSLVLFLSRVHPKKGLVYLIQAWASLQNLARASSTAGLSTRLHPPPTWQMVIAGPSAGEHQQMLSALAAELGLLTADLQASYQGVDSVWEQTHADIIFTGPVYGEMKEELHAAASVFVLPSFSENFGAVVTDSLAHGVPVITTRGTPWARLHDTQADDEQAHAALQPVHDRRCGWWIEVGTPPLADALREAMTMDTSDLQAMGLRGRRMVEQHYAWPAVAATLLQAYRDTLQRRSTKANTVAAQAGRT